MVRQTYLQSAGACPLMARPVAVACDRERLLECLTKIAHDGERISAFSFFALKNAVKSL